MVFVIPYFRTFFFGKFCNSLYLGFRSTPLTYTDDRLYPAPIPNYFNDFRVCMSAAHDWFTRSYFVSKIYKAALTKFWNAGFTSDSGVGYWPDHQARSLELWEQQTKQNPEFALQFDWDTTTLDIRQYSRSLSLICPLIPMNVYLPFFGAESPYLWYSRGYLPSERPQGARRQVAL